MNPRVFAAIQSGLTPIDIASRVQFLGALPTEKAEAIPTEEPGAPAHEVPFEEASPARRQCHRYWRPAGASIFVA
jgi:hypothetical protein